MSNTIRRKFLKGSLYGAAGASTFCNLPASAKPTGANGDIRVAVICCGGRGSGHVKGVLHPRQRLEQASHKQNFMRRREKGFSSPAFCY